MLKSVKLAGERQNMPLYFSFLKRRRRPAWSAKKGSEAQAPWGFALS
jgi:hypothetical protein